MKLSARQRRKKAQAERWATQVQELQRGGWLLDSTCLLDGTTTPAASMVSKDMVPADMEAMERKLQAAEQQRQAAEKERQADKEKIRQLEEALNSHRGTARGDA